MRANSSKMAFVLCCGILAATAAAQDATQQEMRSLDGQVQEIKSDVLQIARDLALLEERLLYPSNTHLAVFIEMGAEDAFRLDAVSIEIDGEAVAHHIYTFKELEALGGGGVQRIYTGNVTSGTHQLTVAVNGKLASGRDFNTSQSFGFSKGVAPQLLGLTLADGSGGASIEVADW